jgi:hypothetical protein
MPDSIDLPFSGLTVIITGDAEGFTRQSANMMIERLGGQPVGSISSKTGLVIMGEGAGISKMNKVRIHDTAVLDEQQFIDLVKAFGAGEWDGVRPGIPISEYDALHADPDPDPDPVELIPMSERHLVGTATNFPRHPENNKVYGEKRHWCAKCGHKWRGDMDDYGHPVCPVASGVVAQPQTEPPWLTHLPLSEAFAPRKRKTPAALVAAQRAKDTSIAPPREMAQHDGSLSDLDENPQGYHDDFDAADDFAPESTLSAAEHLVEDLIAVARVASFAADLSSPCGDPGDLVDWDWDYDRPLEPTASAPSWSAEEDW